MLHFLVILESVDPPLHSDLLVAPLSGISCMCCCMQRNTSFLMLCWLIAWNQLHVLLHATQHLLPHAVLLAPCLGNWWDVAWLPCLTVALDLVRTTQQLGWYCMVALPAILLLFLPYTALVIYLSFKILIHCSCFVIHAFIVVSFYCHSCCLNTADHELAVVLNHH